MIVPRGDSTLADFGGLDTSRGEVVKKGMMAMELLGKTARGRPKRRLIDLVGEDLSVVERRMQKS